MKIEQLDLVEYLEKLNAPAIAVIDDSDRGGNYIDQFQVGDRVIDDSPPHPYAQNKGCGTIERIKNGFFYIQWDGRDDITPHGTTFINSDKWLKKAVIDAFLENSQQPVDNFPETPKKVATHGYLENYEVKGRNDAFYVYTRYVYQENNGKLKHYHIPQKQAEAIAAMWHDGATAKEICNALGKNCELQ